MNIKSYMCTAVEETNIESILAVRYELALEEWPEKISGPYRIWTHDLCDTGAALYQLSLQANWELVNKPSKWWIMAVNIWKS